MTSQPNQTDLVFQALASRPRRLIMDIVKRMPGCCVNDICENFDISRIGVMKHLNILVEAKLVISRKQGRSRQLFFNAAPIQMIYDRWTDEYSAFWATQAVDLKKQVEGKRRQAAAQEQKPLTKTKRKAKVAK
jgi:DNA-binding transcriptional ArsR family regulator